MSWIMAFSRFIYVPSKLIIDPEEWLQFEFNASCVHDMCARLNVSLAWSLS